MEEQKRNKEEMKLQEKAPVSHCCCLLFLRPLSYQIVKKKNQANKSNKQFQ